MPTNSSRKKAVKSSKNIRILTRRASFNWKFAIFAVVLVVLIVGYVLIRFSSAAAYTWTPTTMKVEYGELTTKNSRQAIVSLKGGGGEQRISVFAYSSVPGADTYCFDGRATGDVSSWLIQANLEGNSRPIAIVAGSQTGPIVAGDFTRCLYMEGNITGIPRKINFIAKAPGDKPIFVYSMYRIGADGPAIKR
ncbi:MAG: hypothetical protein QG658_444 [Patescibacteria group bacterium]|jgi:hypothetical protein|nr:hypothetical protein [Patescibacteria group bacterium]